MAGHPERQGGPGKAELIKEKEVKNMASNTRNFNGKKYYLKTETGKKSNAEESARRYRARGYQARVVKLGMEKFKGRSYQFWGVYIRKN